MFYEKTVNSLPHNWLIHHYLVLSIKKHAVNITGRVLDIGCGEKPYKEIIEAYCNEYIGLDHFGTPHGLSEVNVIGDALALPFDKDSFDSVVSFQVMEHVSEPGKYLSEAFRVLRPGGYMLLTTPFMWGEHEQPSDYYRYTRYGLRYLAKRAGFTVVSIEPNTGYWATSVLRFNYWLKRFAKGPLHFLLAPVWLNQYIAILLDNISGPYTIDSSTFTTLLRKPL